MPSNKSNRPYNIKQASISKYDNYNRYGVNSRGNRRKIRKKRKNARLGILAVIAATVITIAALIFNNSIKNNKSNKEDNNMFSSAQLDMSREFLSSISDIDNEVEEEHIDVSMIENSQFAERKDELVALAETDDYAKKIVNNILEYPDYMVELLLRNHETSEYVYNYINRDEYLNEEIELTEEEKTAAESGEFPYFIQWDKRWGYQNYGPDTFALNACGPTNLAMVICKLNKDSSVTPLEMAKFSEENGYLDGNLTKWLLMSEGIEAFGIHSKELPLHKNTIINALKEGHPVIVSMRKGDFTEYGHFVLLRGVTEDGKILVYDSNSYIRTNKEWDYEVFEEQAANLWKFYK